HPVFKKEQELADKLARYETLRIEFAQEAKNAKNTTTNALRSEEESVDLAVNTPNLKNNNVKIFQIPQAQAQEIQNYFNFREKKPLLREMRENEIAHALKSHGDEIKEAQRGNIAITRADIEQNYPKITQEYDERFFTDKSVIYVKQVNGHHIAIEEALLGQDKLIFKSLWKTKGNYNRQVLLKNAKATPNPHISVDEVARTKSNPSLHLSGDTHDNTLGTNNSTADSLNLQDFTAKYAKFKEQLFTEVRQSFENE
ncbi:hypothetical protein CCZ01_09860, partial [Helicobacter monodelphidis]